MLAYRNLSITFQASRDYSDGMAMAGDTTEEPHGRGRVSLLMSDPEIKPQIIFPAGPSTVPPSSPPPAFSLAPLPTPRSAVPGFDPEAGRTWIYPTNYPLRTYQVWLKRTLITFRTLFHGLSFPQYSIVRACLYQNTLVTLPTGLGKTFIAAVVMYNYFRWFPSAKIVFMAPTKPLVAQQVNIDYNFFHLATPLE